MPVTRLTRVVALSSYLGLLLLTALWEGWLLPSSYAPAAFWLSVKTVPLLIPLLGLLKGKPKIYFVTCLLVLAYFTEGVILAYSERHAPPNAGGILVCAWLEIFLTGAFFFSAAFYVRFRGTHEPAP